MTIKHSSEHTQTVNGVPANQLQGSEPEHLLRRVSAAVAVLHSCIEVNARKRGGIPLLKGTRFTVAQLFAEIAEGRSVVEIAEDFELDLGTIREVLQGFATYLDQPHTP